MPHHDERMFSEYERLPVIEMPPITEEQLIRYAGASGDFNPIHTIEKKAREHGLPGVIAHGMLTMAFMARPFSVYWQQGGFLRDFKARFKAKVFVGDILQVIVTREAKRHAEDHFDGVDHMPQSESPKYKHDIQVVNQNGVEVASGTATIQFIRRPSGL